MFLLTRSLLLFLDESLPFRLFSSTSRASRESTAFFFNLRWAITLYFLHLVVSLMSTLSTQLGESWSDCSAKGRARDEAEFIWSLGFLVNFPVEKKPEMGLVPSLLPLLLTGYWGCSKFHLLLICGVLCVLMYRRYRAIDTASRLCCFSSSCPCSCASCSRTIALIGFLPWFYASIPLVFRVHIGTIFDL